MVCAACAADGCGRGLLGSGFGLLLGDRLDDVGERGRLRIQAAHDLGDELLARQDVGQSLHLVHALHSAVHHAGLDGQRGHLLVLLAARDELLDHLGTGDRIVVAEDKGRTLISDRPILAQPHQKIKYFLLFYSDFCQTHEKELVAFAIIV